MTLAPPSLDDYVRQALKLQGYNFGEAQIKDISAQFARLAAAAASLEDVSVPLAASGAPVFRP